MKSRAHNTGMTGAGLEGGEDRCAQSSGLQGEVRATFVVHE